MNRSRLAAALLLAALTLAPQAVQAQDAGPIYVVQEGDTLIGIASSFGTTADALASANGLADPSAIFPGMRLLIPGYEGVSGVLDTVPVGAGETLESLALRYGVPTDGLARLNRLANPSSLYVGMALIVPMDDNAPPPPPVELRLPGSLAGLIGRSVESGSNPWTVAGWNRRPSALWIDPAQPLYLPAEPASVDALPEGWTALELRPDRPGQGRTLVVEALLTEGASVSGSLGEHTLHFEVDPEDPDRHLALQGIHVLAEPGLVELRLVFRPADDPEAGFEFTQPVRIAAEDYGREFIRVPAETIDPANTVPEDAQIAAVVSQTTPVRLWDGPFAFPTDYYESFPSFFGTRRNYNDTGYNYYHTGLDLYGSSSTQIRAPAPGVVVFAAELTVRGYTTYIDHGWGVFTGYLHQSQIFVAPGDRVAPGDVIGMVGGTGRVTGPHLHWEVWVGGVPVQPLEWTATAWP